MKTIPKNAYNVISALFVVEQVLVHKEIDCELCKAEGCEVCKQKGRVETEEIVPKQPLTEVDTQEFYKKLAAILNEYGFKVDAIGEKRAMINRLARKTDVPRYTAAEVLDFATKIHNSVTDLNHTRPTQEDLKLWEITIGRHNDKP